MMGTFSPHILYSSTSLNKCLQPWWGCISASGVGDIIQIDGITNTQKYRQVIINYAIPSGTHLIGNGLDVFLVSQ